MDIVTLGRLNLNLSSGWTTKLTNYKPISSLYIHTAFLTNTKDFSISQTKIVRFQAPAGLNSSTFRPNPKSIRHSLERNLLSDHDTNIVINSSTRLWQHIMVSDLNWEFRNKQGDYVMQFERVIPVGMSTYQVHQTFRKTSKFTAANRKEAIKIWEDLLNHITTK